MFNATSSRAMRTPHRAALAAACTTLALGAAAHAADIVRNAGGSTPNLSDFSPIYAKKAPGVGYGNGQAHQMFLETLPARCGAPHERVIAASFFLTVRKLSTTLADAQHTQLKFWDRGVEHFSTTIWQPHEPVGAVKTVTYNIAGLPSPNRMVRHNDGWGMALLADRDFSFSVNDDAGVLSARLHYQCGHRGGNYAGASASQPTFYPLPLSNSTSAPTVGIGPGSVTFRGSHGIGPHLVQSVPCPHTNVNFGRAAINNSPFMAHVQNFADTQCANRGAPRGFYSVRIQSCNPNSNGGYSAPIEVTCLR